MGEKWFKSFDQREMFTLPSAPAGKEGSCVRWSVCPPHFQPSVSCCCPHPKPGQDAGGAVPWLVHLRWTSPALTSLGWCLHQPAHMTKFPEGDSEHCPVCNMLIGRCPWHTWHTPWPHGYIAGTASLAEVKAASCRAAGRAAGSWGWRWS